MRAKIAGIAIALIALFAAVYWYVAHRQTNSEAGSDPNAAFTLVDAADRSFDGAPALALTFSLPLDSGKNVDKYLRVFEMPGTVEGAPRENADEEDEESRGAKGK